MSAYNFEEPPPFDTAGPSVPAVTGLARQIAKYLREHPGFRTMPTICGVFIREKGHTLTQLNEALRQLQAEKIYTCCSCKGLISETTCHDGSCPHGS